jgi:hypothetical protein
MKYWASLIVVVAAAASALQAARHLAVDRDPWDELRQARRQAEEIEEFAQRRLAFAQRFAEILERVEKDQLPLADAVRAVEHAALVEYAAYLGYLMIIEGGETVEEKIAFNIARHFRAQHRRLGTSTAAAVLARCEGELRDYLGKAPAEARPALH